MRATKALSALALCLAQAVGISNMAQAQPVASAFDRELFATGRAIDRAREEQGFTGRAYLLKCEDEKPSPVRVGRQSSKPLDIQRLKLSLASGVTYRGDAPVTLRLDWVDALSGTVYEVAAGQRRRSPYQEQLFPSAQYSHELQGSFERYTYVLHSSEDLGAAQVRVVLNTQSLRATVKIVRIEDSAELFHVAVQCFVPAPFPFPIQEEEL